MLWRINVAQDSQSSHKVVIKHFRNFLAFFERNYWIESVQLSLSSGVSHQTIQKLAYELIKESLRLSHFND